MVKKSLFAGVAVAAFGQIVQAEPIPDFASIVTPESAYWVLDHSKSCLLASEALNPPQDTLLSPDQAVIATVTATVVQSELGKIVVDQNAADDVFYCRWDLTEADGLYVPAINTAIISTYSTGPMAVAAEEFVHAYQQHTNPYIQSANYLTRYGLYITTMANESQAKIWAEKILFDVAPDLRIPENSPAMMETNRITRECLEDNNGQLNAGCMKEAFESFIIKDNLYTDLTMFQVGQRFRGTQPQQAEYDVCGLNFPQYFGYIYDKGEKVQYLEEGWLPQDILRADAITGRGEDNKFSQQFPLALRTFDDLDRKKSSNAVVSKNYPCFEQ